MNPIHRTLRRALFAIVWLTLAVSAVAGAADGLQLSGRVADVSGNPLAGARVHLEPRGVDLVTDSAGRFVIDGLAAGHCVIEISYVGFASEKREMDLGADHNTRLVVTLRLDEQVSEAITVTASRSSGEVRALNQQKTAQNIVNVLPEEVITSLPNTNVADAVGRLPSVSLERDEGEGKYVQIRGTEPRLSNFEINGVHIPSPEASVRNVKLDIIPSDLVGSIELHKTLSADQEGDAIGGTVNLITKTAGDQPSWTVSAHGGQTSLLSRKLYQANANYATRFGPEHKGGFVVGGGYDWNGRGINDIEPSVDSTDVGSGPSPVFTALDLREYRYERSRAGLSSSLDYRLTPDSSVYMKGLLADFKNYGDRWVVSPEAGSFVTPTTTDDSGVVSRSVQNRRPHEQIYSLVAGGENTSQRLLLDYHLAFSHSQQNRLNQLQADFAGPDAVAFAVDASDPYFPRLTPINGVNIDDPNLYTLDAWRISNERTAGHDLAGAADASLSHRLGEHDATAKFGIAFRDEHKSNDNADRFFSATGAPGLLLSDALEGFSDPEYYFNKYELGPLPSLGAVQRFVAAHPDAVEEDLATNHLKDDPNNFTAKERIVAAYLMDTLTLGRARIDLGVRAEHTNADYTGHLVLTDTHGDYVATTPTAGTNSYTSVLPRLNAVVELDPHTNLRASAGFGIARPHFADLPPFLLINDRKNTVDAGNPDLKPTRSVNYDLMAERYFTSVGFASVGVFYKDLHDPIYPGVESELTSGPFAGFTQSQPINGPKAHIFGFEASWQQRLSFLPGIFKDFGVLANYTHTTSSADVPGRDDSPALLRTTPTEFNFGLTYDHGPFSGRVAVTYNDANIWEYNFSPGTDLGIHGPGGDVYLYAHTQVDAQATYAFGNGLQAVINLLNLNNAVFGFYQGSKQFPIQREFYGRTLSIGLRFTS